MLPSFLFLWNPFDEIYYCGYHQKILHSSNIITKFRCSPRLRLLSAILQCLDTVISYTSVIRRHRCCRWQLKYQNVIWFVEGKGAVSILPNVWSLNDFLLTVQKLNAKWFSTYGPHFPEYLSWSKKGKPQQAKRIKGNSKHENYNGKVFKCGMLNLFSGTVDSICCVCWMVVAL